MPKVESCSHFMPTYFSDKQLVAKSQQGDKRAFDLLVMRYQNRLSSIVNKYCKSSVETEDVVQEAFIKAYKGIGSFRGESAFYTWLCRIAINVANSHLASSARRARNAHFGSVEELGGRDDVEIKEEVTTADGNFFGDELIDVIQSALLSMPEELRQAVILREIEGLSYEDISSMMMCPIGTVRSRIFRAREVLNSRIKNYTDA